MDIPVDNAEGKLRELLERVDSGEEVVLTRDGRPPVRLISHSAVAVPRFSDDAINDIIRRAATEALPGPDAAHSQDFLYDEFGLPN
jgi:prevent-host-death family protein